MSLDYKLNVTAGKYRGIHFQVDAKTYAEIERQAKEEGYRSVAQYAKSKVTDRAGLAAGVNDTGCSKTERSLRVGRTNHG